MRLRNLDLVLESKETVGEKRFTRDRQVSRACT